MKIQAVLKWQGKDQTLDLKAKKNKLRLQPRLVYNARISSDYAKNNYVRVFCPSRSIVKSTQFNAKLALLVSSDDVQFLKT